MWSESALAVDAAGKLERQAWMDAPETRAVVTALEAGGSKVRFVGGCVRDAILGRPVRDIDIATADEPQTVMDLLGSAGVRTIPTGFEHGTVTAVYEGEHFEITTLRRDVETFGRHARVAFTDDWKADAARRDFTINALFLDPDGTLFDPTGGLADLEAGRVRFVGEAQTRIKEDYLRILRFFRFQAHYGRQEPDEAALVACRSLAPNLSVLSAERVRAELMRLLAAPEPAAALRLMAANAVLAEVLPEAGAIDRLEHLAALETGAIEADPLRRMAAALDVDAPGAAALAERLKMSNRERARLVLLAAPPHPITAEMDARAARRALFRVGAEGFGDLVLLAWAGAGDGAGEDWRRLLEEAGRWRTPRLPVKGADIVALGVEAGPQVGRLLAEIEAWWEEGDFQADRAEALKELERRLAVGSRR